MLLIISYKSDVTYNAYNLIIRDIFQEISLGDYKGKWVVLFFYPLDFTFVCPTEIIAFSEASEKFEKINTSVIAASTGQF